MKMRFAFPFISAVAIAVLPGMSRAATVDATLLPIDDDTFHNLETVPDLELAEQRGGFAIAGMEVRLGAEMRTYLNGDLVLRTVVNWDTMGATTTQMASAALTQSSMEALQAGFATGGSVSLKIGDTPVYLANSGQTALAQRTDGAIQNIILNTASNLALTQQTDATIDISGYQAFHTSITNSRLSDALGGALGNMMIGAATR
jgi:hypothetical protein